MSPSSVKSSVCIFCFENEPNTSPKGKNCEENSLHVRQFFTMVQRYFEVKSGWTNWSGNGNSRTPSRTIPPYLPVPVDLKVACCDDCFTIVDSYLDIYHKLKCLELELDKYVDKIKGVMTLADEDASKINGFIQWCLRETGTLEKSMELRRMFLENSVQHQSQPQHSHPQQTSFPIVAPQPQEISRQEQEGQVVRKKKKKKNLQINDAKKGQNLLVSISTTTSLDHYATPCTKKNLLSPPLQPPIEKFAEEGTTLEKEPSKDGAVSEEIIEPEKTEPTWQIDVKEISDSVQESEVRADSELSGSVEQEDELEKDDESEIDEPEASEEPQQNEHVPLDDCELEDDDDGEDESLMGDGEADNQKDLTGSVKGRIKYDRDFLLLIRNKSEVINEFKAAENGFPDLVRGNDVSFGNKRLTPHQRMQHKRAMGMGMGNWGGMMVPPPPHNRALSKVQQTLIKDEVKLHKAENAWKPGILNRSKSDQQADEEAIAVESIVKKTRGILNKLTPDNFEKMVSKFMELPLECKDERISNVIRVFFEKAIDEEFSFSTAFIRMVHTISKTSQLQETSKKFRMQILDQCRMKLKSDADEADIKEMEKKLVEATDDETRKQLKLDLEVKRFMNRRRSLGNVRFIGELYMLKMLEPKIMVECVHLLLYVPDDEKLERLCKLLTNVGQRLDIQLKSLEYTANGGNKPTFVPEKKWMTKIFNHLKELSENKKFSSRIRFAILNVVELRENDWKPRRNTNAT